MTQRHNQIRDMLYAFAAPVAQPGSLAKEQGLDVVDAHLPRDGEVDAPDEEGVPPQNSGLDRPGDVVYRLSQQPRLTMIDTTVRGIRATDSKTTRIASRAESDKRTQFDSRYRRRAGEARAGGSAADGVNFVPFGMLSFRFYGPHARK